MAAAIAVVATGSCAPREVVANRYDSGEAYGRAAQTVAAVGKAAASAADREASAYSQTFSEGVDMGGSGSGRKRTTIPVVRVSHAERRQQRYRIAVYAVQHGVRATMAEFDVSETKVRKALWTNKMHPAREVNTKIGVTAIGILKRMLLDHESADAAAAAVGATVTYARSVRRAAQAAGFIFQETGDDGRHGVNAEEPDGGERGESPAVG